MNITIYHGSKDIIEKPEYGKGKPYKDYGLGFYCTQEPDMAKEFFFCQRFYKRCYFRPAAGRGNAAWKAWNPVCSEKQKSI